MAIPYVGTKLQTTTHRPNATFKYATRFQAGDTFTATFMAAYFSAELEVDEPARLAIYADSAGVPGALLGQTDVFMGTGSAQWIAEQLQSGVSITSGTYYWLCYQIDTNSLTGCEATSGGNSFYNVDIFADGIADPFGAGTSDNDIISIYASRRIAAADLSKGGAVVETSGGTKYAVFVDNNVLVVYKDVDGVVSVADSDTAATVHGAGNIAWCHAAIDSNDDIHIVCQCDSEQTRDVAYAVFDCGTDTLGAWEEAADYDQQEPVVQTSHLCQISVDSSDQPHIIYTDNVKISGGKTDQIYYTWNDGSWNGPEQVNATATKNDHMRQPQLTHCPADDVEALYYDAGYIDVLYRRREIGVGWDTENSYAEVGLCQIGFGGVTCTTGDAVYRYHTDDDFDIEENDVDTTYNPHFSVPLVSAALDGTTRYVFYVDFDFDVHLISNDGGGWVDEGALQTGTLEKIIAQYSYLNNNQSGELSYIFDDGTNVYYDSFTLAVEAFPPVPGRVHKDWRFPHRRM